VRIVTGDLWQQEGIADIILVTTNSTLNSKGHLVMGRGAAAEAASRYPSLPLDLGNIINLKRYGQSIPYGVLIVPGYANGVTLGAFQVKFHWRDAAAPFLINLASQKLTHIAEALPGMEFAMNYPGIGNGRLREEDVYPLIKSLPDNVTVYKKE
jgi:hypothetical protein